MVIVMTVHEMWEQYRTSMGALAEDKAVFYAGAEAVVAKVAVESRNPATRQNFDPRRVAIALDEVGTECIKFRNAQPQVTITQSLKPS